MSISLVAGPIQSFIGLSTDTKPTVGVPAGSSFFETDTASGWVYDGIAWRQLVTVSQTDDLLRAQKLKLDEILSQLKRLNANFVNANKIEPEDDGEQEDDGKETAEDAEDAL